MQCSYAFPRATGGFAPGPIPVDDANAFPMDPPNLADGNFVPRGAAPSFFTDNFETDMATTARPVVRGLGDHDGDGANTNEDNPRNIRIDERGHAAPIDLRDMDMPPVIGGGNP